MVRTADPTVLLVGLVVHEDQNGNRFYDHELMEMKNLDQALSQAGDASQSEVGHTVPSRGSINSIVLKLFSVNKKTESLSSEDKEKYARPRKPAPGQQELRWITIGGSDGGEDGKHVGGTPVQVDSEGKIHAGPVAFAGKSLDDLDKDKAGTEGDERKPAKQLKEGQVQMVQAPAGGAKSDVDGKFYKGGQWMPVHGHSTKRDDEPPKPQKTGGEAPVANENRKQPTARDLSPEQRAEETERREQARRWSGIQTGPLGKVVHRGI